MDSADLVAQRTRQWPRNADLALYCAVALLFAASTAWTVTGCKAMASMGGMAMPGGWTLSMAWMRMPGQTWPGVAASFLGMWIVMMVAMMLPSLLPMLHRYRRRIADHDLGATQPGYLTAVVGLAYFLVWTLTGFAVFALGVALASLAMQQPMLSRAVPLALGGVVMFAGLLQWSRWKMRHLVCCRQSSGSNPDLPANARSAWRHGLRLGVHCCCCCAPLTAILLAVGVMDLAAMVLVAAAISVERLAPGGDRLAHAVGVAIIAVGLFQVAGF